MNASPAFPGALTPEIVASEPLVRMFTAPNPSPKTLEGTHTFVLGSDEGYVIDPGPAIDRYQTSLARLLKETGFHTRAILLSHGHPDHAPGAVGLAALLRAPICASPDIDMSYFDIVPRITPLEIDASFPVDGDVLRAVLAPGHSRDHVVFFLENAQVLFSGDTILGRGTSLVAPPEGDMTTYMQTLERLRELRPRIIAPGHGPLIDDPAAKFDEYVRHRHERERQVLAALAGSPNTVKGLVKLLYADLDPRLHGFAAGSVQAQLDKLRAEGRVGERGGRYELLTGAG